MVVETKARMIFIADGCDGLRVKSALWLAFKTEYLETEYITEIKIATLTTNNLNWCISTSQWN